MRAGLLGLIFVLMQPASALAEAEFSFYGGVLEVNDSQVTGADPLGAGAFSFSSDWEGRSFSDTPYYGFRVTWWPSDQFGWGVNFNHAKAYASDQTLSDNNLNKLEFSDGLNLLTVNAYRRWTDLSDRITPYVGGGVGVSIPHVEYDSGSGSTSEYQLGGPAVQWMAGASYPLNENVSVFGEYQGSYSVNNTTLNGGGKLDTRFVTGAVNLGVSLGF